MKTIIDNSQTCYNPVCYCTVNEQLFPIKDQCRVIQFMSKKPDKYGVKFRMLVEVKNKYVVNDFPYLEKDHERAIDTLLGEFVVEKLFDGLGLHVI